MSILLFFAIVMVITSASFLVVTGKEKRQKRAIGKLRTSNELKNLYEYKYFLKGVKQAKMELHIKLTTISYYKLQNKIFFSPFEINVLKEEISANIHELEEMILDQSISPTDFNRQIQHINKRIDVLSYPLASVLQY
ncbi:hypothetical protein JN11_02422 [Mucilaginibacter frigoritolerans]|uniref:Uncharacterized protein n=1 Tax=Mucilaginibacter frigoritolerans TaxID=652788 RepID=A0A562U3U7_9SPHI|nr:hypothetical protein [Mucilaginibacter frigoritolerans]TWJ00007.1 hypothetical protein JN11_02422 [Mucilaginibacter frigoritolerans]